jgi:hypothetical protein
MLKELHSKLPYHENVVEFIRLNCDDEIDLRRKTDGECGSILKSAGLIEIDGGFDYLLKLPMRSLTTENIDKHNAELKMLKTKIDSIEKKYPHEMWIQDLSMLKLI